MIGDLPEGENPAAISDDIAEETGKMPARREVVRQYIDGMTTEEKVAQLFIVNPEVLSEMDFCVEEDGLLRRGFERYPVGGLIYFTHNLQTSSQVKNMLRAISQYSEELVGLPIFNCVDEEGGSVKRIAGNSGFDIPDVGNMSDIGFLGDVNEAYGAGLTIGGYLSELGFNMNFAPVADVITNPENTVIGKRSFGTDCNLVADMVVSALRGLKEQGIVGAVKHFPGHGATCGDTHDGYDYTDNSLGDMLIDEIVPFEAAIEAGVRVVMVGHFSAPQITGDSTPCSLSRPIVTELLREHLGYDGIIITDALNMKAVTGNYSTKAAAITALNAGNDLLLMPDDFQEAYTGVLDAVNSGELSIERIDESLGRIINLKLDIASGN